MPQLDPTWFASQAFWLVMGFMLLFVLLRQFFLPPILQVMQGRETTLAEHLSQAQTMKSQAQEAQTSYEKALAASRSQAQAAIAQSMAEARTQADAATAKLDASLRQQLSAAQTTIAARRDAFSHELHANAGGLVRSIIQRLTQREPTADQLERALKSVSK